MLWPFKDTRQLVMNEMSKAIILTEMTLDKFSNQFSEFGRVLLSVVYKGRSW